MPRQRASIASAFRERKLPMEEKKELLDQDERVVEIELERLRGFVNHPFKVQADSQMIELQESIKKYGKYKYRRTILCGVRNLCSIVFSFFVKLL